MGHQSNSMGKGRLRRGVLSAAVLAAAVMLSIGSRALPAVEPDEPPVAPEARPLPAQMEYPDSYPPEGGQPMGGPGEASYDREDPETYGDEPRRSDPDDTGYGRESSPSTEEPGLGPGWPTDRRSNRWREPVRRSPAPIPPGRALPFYPPEPPPSAPASSAITAPPDFIGSAAGALEIPVGQTATLFVRGYQSAGTREERIARVVARETDRVLVRGRFPGRTLLEIDLGDRRDIYIVRVR